VAWISKKVNYAGTWGRTSKTTVKGWPQDPNQTGAWGKSSKSTWGGTKVAEKTLVEEVSDNETASATLSSKKNKVAKDINDTQSFSEITNKSKEAVKKQDLNCQTNENMIENLKVSWNNETGTIEDLKHRNEKKERKFSKW